MKRHDSMRGYFSYELFEWMGKDPNIWLVTGDLGYGVFDAHREAYPDRFINTGAAEQAMMGIAVGLALAGRKVFVYSITTFLLRRPFETIKLYIDHEQIPVRLIGSGRDRDYAHDGISHWSEDDKDIMRLFPDIDSRWPTTKEEIPSLMETVVNENKPWYLNLTR